MARKRGIPHLVCEEIEPDPNAEARYLEGKPHGGRHYREFDETRHEDEFVGEGRYTHYHNPQMHRSRTLASEPEGRRVRDASMDDGASFVEPIRSDLFDDEDFEGRFP